MLAGASGSRKRSAVFCRVLSGSETRSPLTRGNALRDAHRRRVFSGPGTVAFPVFLCTSPAPQTQRALPA
eukprot:7233781-Heterocapsa_arctica.AAC.1